MSRRIFIIAAEASGDALAADLIDALKRREPDISIGGVGGPQMAARGASSPIDIASLAILGFVDGVKAYGRVVRLADEVADAALAFRPDEVVLVDSWGFTLRVGQRVRARAPAVKLMKYVGPQVWATRPGRAKTLASVVDHLICIHDFEPRYYEPFRLACTVCGHPAIGRHRPGDGKQFRARHGLGDERVLLLLPGSRRSELRRTAPIVFAAAERLAREDPRLRIVVVAGRAVEAGVRSLLARQPYPALTIGETEEKEDAFNAATAALAVSGTVTTEVALQGTPVVVGYRLGWVSWALARAFLLKSRYATLMNVAADAEVAPEFLQTRCTPQNLAAATAPLLADPRARAAQVAAQDKALIGMGRGGRPAAEIAAEAVLELAAAAAR